MVFVPKNGKRDTMQWVSIEIEISSRVEEKETVPTGLQSMHGREGGKFDIKKREKHKMETNA